MASSPENLRSCFLYTYIYICIHNIISIRSPRSLQGSEGLGHDWNTTAQCTVQWQPHRAREVDPE
eukprot:6107483-Pyramimonas_sp.AAC.1